MKIEMTNEKEKINSLKSQVLYYEMSDDFDIDVAIKMYKIIYDLSSMLVSKDPQEMTWIERENSEISSTIGNLYLAKNDPVNAIKWYKKGINQTDLGFISASNIGDLYKDGKYVEKSLDKAISYYEKAGYVGFDIIGDMYFFGDMLPKDINKALEYYKKAKEYNYNISVKLGFCELLLNNREQALNYFNERREYLEGDIDEIACRVAIAYLNNDQDTINMLIPEIEGIDRWYSFVAEFVTKE